MKITGIFSKFLFFLSALWFVFGIGSKGLIAQSPERVLLKNAKEIVEIIKTANFKLLSEYVHIKKGLQFSPHDRETLSKKPIKYPNNPNYTTIPNITHFTKKEVKNFFDNNRVYSWGSYSGTGFEIKLKPKEYYSRFIYTIDFYKKAKAQYIDNKLLKKTSDLVYSDFMFIYEAYPKSSVVQYFYKGSPKSRFFDYKKLILVFEKIGTDWYLVGIVHGEKSS